MRRDPIAALLDFAVDDEVTPEEAEQALRARGVDVAWFLARARFLAKNVSDEECKALFTEHGSLVDKMMIDGVLSNKDQARLTYVRWQLERIEDARVAATAPSAHDTSKVSSSQPRARSRSR